MYAKREGGFPPATLKQVINNQSLLFYDVGEEGLYGRLRGRVFVSQTVWEKLVIFSY